MKAIQIKTKDELQSFLQSVIERIEALETHIDNLDREIEVISDEFYKPNGEGYSV